MTDCGCTNFPASLGNVTFGASVGIGASSPEASLHVAGTILAAGGGRLALGRNDGSDPASSKTWQLDNDAGPDGAGNDLRFFQQPTLTTAGTVYLIIKDGGNVGIGTISPGYPLDVAGTVRCTGVLLGGNMNLSGAIYDSTGQYKRVDYQGCYYA